MFLSIIVPVYNVEKYISQCIESILNQTFKDFELILVDDGSTDRSGVICDEYAAKDDRIKVIHKENGGHSSARIEGLKVSSGEYIGFVDSDDWIEPDMYECMCNKALSYDADIVTCNVCREYQDGTTKKEVCSVTSGSFDKDRLLNEVYPIMLSTEPFYAFGIWPSLWNKIYKRELIQKHIETMDTKIMMGEDAAVTYPCMLEANKICILDGKFFYHYRVINSSMTRSYKPTYMKSNISLYRRLAVCFDRPELGDVMQKQLDDYIVFTSADALRNEFSKQNNKSFAKKVSAIKAYISDEQISNAFINIDKNKINGTTKVIVGVVRKHLFVSLAVLLKLINSR